MKPLDEIIDENFVLRLSRGEPWVFEGQLEDVNGNVEPLAGRTFFACVMAADGTRLREAVAEIYTDSTGVFYRGVIDGSMSDDLFGQSGLLWWQGERTDSGNKPDGQGSLVIYPGPGTDMPTGPSGVAAVATRFIRRASETGRARIRKAQAGARGPSPWDAEGETLEAYNARVAQGAIDLASQHVGDAILDLGEAFNQKSVEVDEAIAGGLAQKPDAAASVEALATRPEISDSIILTEPGRAGVLRWEPTDCSAAVKIDPRQAVTIAPAFDPTGASGAWVRAFSGEVNVQWFGAVSDPTGANVAANSAAFQAALDFAKAQAPGAFQGALRIYVPAGWYCVTNVVQSGGSITWTGDGEQISVVFNLHPSARCVRFQPGLGQHVATHVNLEGLSFANCVDRTAGAPPVFSIYQITRYAVSKVAFQSEDYWYRGPFAGDVLEVTYLCETAFQSVRFRAGAGAGGGNNVCAGVALTVVDAGQADSLDLDGLTIQGYALDLAFGVKSGSEAEQAGTNSTAIRSGKFLGYQGGSFLSAARDAYAQGTVTSAVVNAAIISVSTTAGMKVGRAFVAGQNTRNGAKGGSVGAPQYGIVTAIDAAAGRITLDRPVTIANGELFLSGTIAVLLGNVSLVTFDAMQVEGKDVGVCSTGGLGISFRDCTLGTPKVLVSHGNFWNAAFEGCRYTLGGAPANGVTKKLATIRGTANNSNRIRLVGNSFVPGSGLTGADITAWVDNQTTAEISGGIDDWRYGVAQGTWGVGSVWKAASGAPVPIGNSIIDNGAMRLWQRGAGPFPVLASNVFNADRWFTTTDVAGNRSVSRTTVTAAEAEAGVQSQYAIDIEQQVGGGSYFILAQAEDEELFRAVDGKTVAFDVKIKLTSGNIGNIRAFIQQRFGTSGSGSKTFFGPNAVLTAGAYASYSGQIAVGQASAFTIGSAPSILVGLDIPTADVAWRIASTDFAMTIGAQRYLFSPRPLVTDVAAAQRFYRTMAVQAINGSLWVPFGMPMARTPNITVSAGTVSGATRDGFLLTHTTSAAVTVTAVCAEP